ncbi:MAG: hypothetical protein HC785_02230 [Calothrix sp. CSU_2_0]|nr:hypothetical protein [Calothrix sp. CSU_2_0]
MWVKYSRGRFGFSVQKEIWESYGSPGFDNKKPYKELTRDWDKFGAAVGWRPKVLFGFGSWITYSGLTFNLSAPRGHLPVLWQKKYGSHDFFDGYSYEFGWDRTRFVKLFSRFQGCDSNIQ